MKCPHKYNIQQSTSVDYEYQDDNTIIKKENRTLLELQTFGKCEEKDCGCWNEKDKICGRR